MNVLICMMLEVFTWISDHLLHENTVRPGQQHWIWS